MTKTINKEHLNEALRTKDEHAFIPGLVSWLIEITEQRVSENLTRVRSPRRFRHVEHVRPYNPTIRNRRITNGQ